MNTFGKALVGSTLLLGLSTPAMAADQSASVGSFGIGIGTAGLGIDYAYPVNPWLDLRAGYDFGSLKRDQTEDDVDYEAKLKFSSGRFLVDVKPFQGGFRITAGLYTGSPELELKASGQDDYEIGDRDYNGDFDVKGDIDLGSSAPYLGIGWGGTAGTTGFGVSFDLGVLFTDSPKVKLAIPRGTACDATENEDCDPATDPNSFTVGDGSEADMQLRAEVEKERRELEDDAKDFDMWPVVRLGLHYRF